MPAASPERRPTGPLWVVLGVAGGVALVWHLAVLCAAVVVGAHRPTVAQSVAAIAGRPWNPLAAYSLPAPPAWLVWPLFGAGLGLIGAGGWWWHGRGPGRASRAGMATRRDLRPYLSAAAQRAGARQTRPRLAHRRSAPMEELALSLGAAEGSRQRLYGSLEDSYAVVGGPRGFKSGTIIVDAVRTGPGPTISVSTKSDLLAATYSIRRRRGRVLVMDPTGVLGWPEDLAWDVVAGCEDPEAAIARAEGLVAAVPKSTTGTNEDFFADQARDVLRCFLHAAALVKANHREVIEWVFQLESPTLRPREILRTHPRAMPLYAMELDALISGEAKETIDSTKKTLARVMATFASSPRVLAACTPAPGEGFDVAAFLDSTDTVYLVVGEGATVAPLATAFVHEILRVARRRSQRLFPPRLDPPLRVVIDEVGACPLPDLPQIMSDSGGRGVTVVLGLQGLGQARRRWGADGAAEVFGSATAKVIMGGTSEPDFLEDMSRLAGEIWVPTSSTTVVEGGAASSTTAPRDRRRLRLDEIRTLPPGTALILYRQALPVVARLVPYWQGPWAADAARSQRAVADVLNRDGEGGSR